MAKRRGSRSDDYGRGYFPASRPIKTNDGIQSRSQRGAFAANWWAKRWLAVLESYGIGSRLQRGRSYARGGQVLSIAVASSIVQARVQGSSPAPYNVTIEVTPLNADAWSRVLDAISAQAIYTAQLLDGTMPQEIETAFETAGVSLFPKTVREIETTCSCPDYSNPCKHIAAVYYLLGEQFDRDPFLLFTMRGRTRDEVIDALRERRAAASGDAAAEDRSLESHTPVPALHDQIATFWGAAPLAWAAPTFDTPDTREGSGTVLRRLGAPPADLKKSLNDLYAAMTAHVRARIGGEDAGSES